jgi:nitrogen fixation/metabolism regulation signal transduction histidine kinase
MFDAIDCDDYSFRFSGKSESMNEKLLDKSLNRIKEILGNVRKREADKEKYYGRILDSVRTGIIVMEDNGNVRQTNNESERMLGLEVITNINQIMHIAPAAGKAIKEINPGESLKADITNELGTNEISLAASDVEYDGKRLKIISINDINKAMNEKEVESWIKLTRILTHEIMNSLAPITSLSETLINIPRNDPSLHEGLETIYKTSRNLISFVESYRKFTRIQPPVKKPFDLKPVIENTAGLVLQEINDSSITVNTKVSPAGLMAYGDEALISQVLVNLIKNAAQALEDAPADKEKTISVLAGTDSDENVFIRIGNTGNAIPKDIAENIFTPFFTTREKGSGVGLSISRQIMLLHRGSLRLTSNRSGNVEFTVTFP